MAQQQETSGEVHTQLNTWVSIVLAALLSSTPGFYSAWQTAKQEWKVKKEQVVRDRQEQDVHKFVKALELDFQRLKTACVSHGDLLKVFVHLKKQEAELDATAVLRELVKEIEKLKKDTSTSQPATKPVLTPAGVVRSKIPE